MASSTLESTNIKSFPAPAHGRDLEAEISAVEKEMEELQKKLAALRKEMPEVRVDDYTFQDSLGNTVRLSELFGDKRELILIQNMGKRCTYCTLWADGFTGFTKHLENRAAFAVATPDDPETQRKFALERGWNFRMFSTKGTSFKHDMGFEPEPGQTWPGVSIFRKKDNGEIIYTNKAGFGPGDLYCSLWHLLDLLPASDTEWHPNYHYE